MRGRVRARRTNFGRRTSGMGNLPVIGGRDVELWTTIHMDGVGGVPRRDTGGTHVLSKLRYTNPRREQALRVLRGRPVGKRHGRARSTGALTGASAARPHPR